MIGDIKNPEYVLTDHLMIHFLELPKLDTSRHETKIRKWLTYLKTEGKEEDIMKILIQEDKEIEKAHNIYQKFTKDEELLEIYEAREKFRKDYASILDSKVEEAEKRGELKKNLEIAKKMKIEGDDIKKIARITGLTIEEIEKL